MVEGIRVRIGVPARWAVLALAAGALMMGLWASTPVAAAKQTATATASNAIAQAANCGRHAAIAQRSRGKKRQRAMANLRRCRQSNKNNRIVLSQVRNAKFVGTRGDGAGIDLTLCASGRFESRVTSHGTTGTYSGKRWIVHSAVVVKGGQFFNALLRSPVPGGQWEISIARRGPRWMVGAESGGKPYMLGPVTRSATRC